MPHRRPQAIGIFQAQFRVAESFLAAAEEGIDAGGLPVTDRQVFIGTIASLAPMPERCQGGEEHFDILAFAAVGFADQFPRPIKTLRGEEVMSRGNIDLGFLLVSHHAGAFRC